MYVGPDIVDDGLTFAIDAGSTRSLTQAQEQQLQIYQEQMDINITGVGFDNY